MMLTGARRADEYLSQYDLSYDRELKTTEIHKPNDFYGNATILKKYVGLPLEYPLKFSIEHSPLTPYLEGWEADHNAKLPGIALWSNMRLAISLKKSPKFPVAIGPMIHYASQALTEEEFQKEKKRLGNSLLVFPQHSTHHYEPNYDAESFFSYLREIRGQFDTVRVCAYWADINKDVTKRLENEGYEIVTAGHIYDPEFLPRLKSIILLSDMTISNSIGTHTHYSILLKKPFYYHDTSIVFTGATQFGKDYLENKDNLLFPIQNFNQKLLELCPGLTVFSKNITDTEVEVISELAGFGFIRTPEEIRELIDLMEYFNQDINNRAGAYFSALKHLNCIKDGEEKTKIIQHEIENIKQLNRKEWKYFSPITL